VLSGLLTDRGRRGRSVPVEADEAAEELLDVFIHEAQLLLVGDQLLALLDLRAIFLLLPHLHRNRQHHPLARLVSRICAHTPHRQHTRPTTRHDTTRHDKT
jgi:hypothetical protein